ncbi:hypothetical protein [Cohaesibacter celericrescens]|uniref:hypothetical protein n=1 Tax=Cohaesibacter celericrescens TaxID=2067669 RepID=UPI003569CFAD
MHPCSTAKQNNPRTTTCPVQQPEFQQRLSASLFAISLVFACLTGSARAEDIPQRLIDNHRATMGCWLADIDNDELADRAIIIHLEAQTFYGFICSSSLSGDSFRLYQVENKRDEWANLLSFPQLDTKLGWYSTNQLQKPTWDEKNKLLRSEIPKQGSTSSCRQFTIYAWQKGRFHIAQVGLAGDCEEKDSEKDMIIYPFVDEVESGQASGQASPTTQSDAKTDKDEKTDTDDTTDTAPDKKAK